MERNGLRPYGVLRAYVEGLGGTIVERGGGECGGRTYFIGLRGKWARIHVRSVHEVNPLDRLHVPHGPDPRTTEDFYHQLTDTVFWDLVRLIQDEEYAVEGPPAESETNR